MIAIYEVKNADSIAAAQILKELFNNIELYEYDSYNDELFINEVNYKNKLIFILCNYSSKKKEYMDYLIEMAYNVIHFSNENNRQHKIYDSKVDNYHLICNLKSSITFMLYLWIRENNLELKIYLNNKTRKGVLIDLKFQKIDPDDQVFNFELFQAPEWISYLDLIIRKKSYQVVESDAFFFCNSIILRKDYANTIHYLIENPGFENIKDIIEFEKVMYTKEKYLETL